MKTIALTVAITFLAGISGWAQSGTGTQSNLGKQGSSAVNKASKANNSQMMGKGVPDNKEKEQFGKPISKKKSGPIPPSSVGRGPEASDASLGNKTPGSHVAQRERTVGLKKKAKTANGSSAKTGN